MRTSFLLKVLSLPVLLLVTFLVSGCGEGGKPPTAISMDQIPAELGKAFASAKTETKELSDLAIAAVQGNELPKASMTLDALAQRPNLSAIQSRTVAGAAMTVNAALREAEAKGDPQAAKTLEIRRMTK